MSVRVLRTEWVLIFAALSLALPGAAHAAEAVGAASSLRPQASQTPQNAARADISLNAQIFRNAVLTTAAKGALEVTFLDKSKLSMGGGSSLVVDEYVYAGPGSPGRQALRYTKGAFRFISGGIPKESVRVETPTVTIGIRGTTLRTLVTEDGTTTVGLDSGDAFVTSKQTGQTLSLGPGEKVTIKPNGVIGEITLGKVEGCD